MMQEPYTKQQIRSGLLSLLESSTIEDITIGQICKVGKVGRASFYRHFSTKEDILSDYINTLFEQWVTAYNEQTKEKNDDLLLKYLFNHLRASRDFYLLLHRNGLFYLLRHCLQKSLGFNVNSSNIEAYVSAFFAYGIYGWAEEWTSRGMPESADEMAELIKQFNK